MSTIFFSISYPQKFITVPLNTFKLLFKYVHRQKKQTNISHVIGLFSHTLNFTVMLLIPKMQSC